jgi:hypothetical protein
LNPAGALALKLVLTPVLVGAASLAGRRWGSAVGGWLVGIPFTSAPVAFFLALDPGPRFAAEAALGIMAGAISQAAFCLVYALTAQRAVYVRSAQRAVYVQLAQRAGWVACLGAASGAFVVATLVLDPLRPSAAATFALVAVILVVALFLMPGRPETAGEQTAFPRWDIPTRMVVATAFVLALTTAAPALGARLAGLIAPFPLYATVLTVFAHRLEGREAAVGVLRGLLLGLFAFASFFLALALLLEQSVALAFAVAIAVAVVVQTASLLVGRRLGLA